MAVRLPTALCNASKRRAASGEKGNNGDTVARRSAGTGSGFRRAATSRCTTCLSATQAYWHGRNR